MFKKLCERRNGKKDNKGFTLVELIVVMAILAILAVAMTPKLTHYIDKARKSNDYEIINGMATAVKLSLLDDQLYKDLTSGTSLIDKKLVISSGTQTAMTVKSSVTHDGLDRLIKEIRGVATGKATDPDSTFSLQSNESKSNKNYVVLELKSQTSFNIYFYYGQASDPTADDATNAGDYDYIIEQK